MFGSNRPLGRSSSRVKDLQKMFDKGSGEDGGEPCGEVSGEQFTTYRSARSYLAQKYRTPVALNREYSRDIPVEIVGEKKASDELPALVRDHTIKKDFAYRRPSYGFSSTSSSIGSSTSGYRSLSKRAAAPPETETKSSQPAVHTSSSALGPKAAFMASGLSQPADGISLGSTEFRWPTTRRPYERRLGSESEESTASFGRPPKDRDISSNKTASSYLQLSVRPKTSDKPEIENLADANLDAKEAESRHTQGRRTVPIQQEYDEIPAITAQSDADSDSTTESDAESLDDNTSVLGGEQEVETSNLESVLSHPVKSTEIDAVEGVESDQEVVEEAHAKKVESTEPGNRAESTESSGLNQGVRSPERARCKIRFQELEDVSAHININISSIQKRGVFRQLSQRIDRSSNPVLARSNSVTFMSPRRSSATKTETNESDNDYEEIMESKAKQGFDIPILIDSADSDNESNTTERLASQDDTISTVSVEESLPTVELTRDVGQKFRQEGFEGSHQASSHQNSQEADNTVLRCQEADNTVLRCQMKEMKQENITNNENKKDNEAGVKEIKRLTPTDYVGFSRLPIQLRRKSIMRGLELNLVVVGEAGLGKSSLINSLFKSKVVTAHPEWDTQRVGDVQEQKCQLTESGIHLNLTLASCPGYGDQVDNSDCWKPIVDYVEYQHSEFMRREGDLNRTHPIPDCRVHACLYFIPPSGHGLRPLDIELLTRLDSRVNILPLVARADSFTQTELKQFKESVLNELRERNIAYYSAAKIIEDDLEFNLEEPLAVVSGEKTFFHEDGSEYLGREYPWGIINIEDRTCCDYSTLRDLLLRKGTIDLIDRTAHIHYETYRMEKLISLNYAQVIKMDEVEKKKMETITIQMETVLAKKVEERRERLRLVEEEEQARLAREREAVEDARRRLEDRRRELAELRQQYTSSGQPKSKSLHDLLGGATAAVGQLFHSPPCERKDSESGRNVKGLITLARHRKQKKYN